MPGAYAHITAVDLMVGSDRLDRLNLPGQVKFALKQNLKFCELGAVSPDYPYLAVGSSGAKKWADLMHYTRTGDVIKAAAERVRVLDGANRNAALAWLLGYTAHVALDLSLHPVVERRVGPYEGNERAHRDCEMHQDVHIFRRLKMGSLDDVDPVRSGMRTCGAIPHFAAVARVWEGALADVHPDEAGSNAPNVAEWHGRYTTLVDMADSALAHFPFARHVADGLGLVYPLEADINETYINGLKTPSGEQSYDAVFDWALDNVGSWWEAVVAGIFDDRARLEPVVNANLDRGTIQGGPEHGSYVFWRVNASAVQS